MTAGTVVHDLMGKEVAVDAEMVMARGTLVATANTHPLGLVLYRLPVIFQRHGWKRKTTGKASGASRGSTPRHLDPVDQGK